MIHNMTNAQILAELDKVVKGHTDAKKHLINLLNRSKTRYFQRHVYRDREDDLVEPAKMLIAGESGTGKTFLVKTLQKIVHFPLLCVDANHFLPTGAGKDTGMKPGDLENLIRTTALAYLVSHRHLYHSYEGVMSQMVIFVDEFDKLGNGWGDYDWHCGTQAAFLTLIENTTNFSDLTWIFAGAFSKSREISKSSAIGFSGKANISVTKIDDEAVVKSGIIPELVGRLTSIVELDAPTTGFYKQLLVDVLIPAKQAEMKNLGKPEVVIDENIFENLCKKAIEKRQGVRGLKRLLNALFLDAEFEESVYIIEEKKDSKSDYNTNNDVDFLIDEITKMDYRS